MSLSTRQPGSIPEDPDDLVECGFPDSMKALPSAPPAANHGDSVRRPRFHLRNAATESFYFLSALHLLRISTQAKTRKGLAGPFWSDYFGTLENLHGWDDGDSFLTNYLGHPLMGAVAGMIQIHNDPHGDPEMFGTKPAYWRSRLKALGWATAFSVQFELGVFSEAAIGNVGLSPRKESRHPMAYVDLVVTPVLGTGWLIAEDAIDRYVTSKLEGRIANRSLRLSVRSAMNPARTIANLFRMRPPWHRTDR